jgi:hypothetical protein
VSGFQQPDLYLVTAGGAPRAALLSDRQVVAAYLRAKAEDFRAGFADYLKENWPLWLAFCRYADRMRARRPHYSADAILHVIRFDTDLAEAPGEGFKINNNWSADFARLYNAGVGSPFFQLRERSAAAINRRSA